MAFNPFTSFRKYQKFWMATILLLCMITFVLCTGVGGDLSDRLVHLFAPRRGDAVAELNSYNVYRRELDDLRQRRDIADLFMRRASQIAVTGLKERMKEPEKIPETKRKETLTLLAGLQKDLGDRLARPRYFEGGVKYQDLLDFMLWLQEADRLGINFQPDAVGELVYEAVHGPYAGFDSRASRQAQWEVRNTNFAATDDLILRALRDEFRVQTAKLALSGAHPELILNPGNAVRLVSTAPQLRKPITPEQIWEDFRANRSEIDVTLIPVVVDDFLKDVPEPSEGDLRILYSRNRDNEFDPTTDKLSFRFPPRMKIEWVSADPESPFYRQASRTVTTLQITPAVAWTPQLSAPLAAIRYASQSAAWDASLERNYGYLKMNPDNFQRFQGPALTDAGFALALAGSLDKTPPATVAALVGRAGGLDSLLAPVAYQADIYERVKKQAAPIIAREAQRRWPLGASMVLSGAASNVLAWSNWLYALEQEQFLPLDAVRAELREKIELNIAHKWVVANMLDVKNKLSLTGIQGKEKGVNLWLGKLTGRFGLEVKATDRFYNRFDIDKAPSLQPFLKSFEKYRERVNIIEGRSGTATALKEGDFWRLFFDSSITHSVENAGLYVAKPWPPYVTAKKADVFAGLNATVGDGQTIPLFEEASRPFLFWQTAFEPARAPASLDEVRGDVVHAWKHLEAREKLALPRARAIAQALQQAGKDLSPVLREQAAKLGRDVITLRNVAPLVATPPSGPMPVQTYGPYQLPRDVFVYAREDMVKQLLELNKLTPDSKEPIKTGNREVDELNEELLKRKLPGKQVQVLTNKPRSVYYVAVVTNSPTASPWLFTQAYQSAAAFRGVGDEFVERYQKAAGDEYREALVKQLRKAADLKPNPRAQAEFDSNAGG
jgi:hypothetical protein